MGGLPIYAFVYDQLLQGIVTEERMPYVSEGGRFYPNMGVCAEEEM